MRFITRIGEWLTRWIPAVVVLTTINVVVSVFLWFRDRRLRQGLYTLQLYTGAQMLSDHALSMHLGLLQTTVVGIGVGITVAGVLGYRSMRDEAIRKAVDAAKERVGAVAPGKSLGADGNGSPPEFLPDEVTESPSRDEITQEPGGEQC